MPEIFSRRPYNLSQRYKFSTKIVENLSTLTIRRWISGGQAQKTYPPPCGKLVHIDIMWWISGGQRGPISGPRFSLSPTYTRFVHRLLALSREVGNFPHRANLALEALLSSDHCYIRSKLCRFVHFSTFPTTTVLSISFKIYKDNSNKGCGKVDKSAERSKCFFTHRNPTENEMFFDKCVL
jgi:hypothetical protein